jgi:aminopeptidase N
MSIRATQRSITLLLVAGALLAMRPLAARADSYPRQPGIDVRAYVFRLELQDGTSAISGEADIDVALKADGVHELWLDLVGRSPDGKTGMSVEGVTSDGRPLVYSHEKNRIRIELGAPSKTGDHRRVTVRYGGTPADGLLIGTNRDGDRVFFGDNFPDRARHWLPTVDHPYDKAACEFVVTAPETYQVVAPGALIETTSLSGGRRLTRYREEVPITTYCMVIGVARFAVETIGQVGGAPVQSWVYATERDSGFSDFRMALQPMQLYSWRIGAYSYEKLANVQSKTRYGGMENSSAIFYAERAVTGQHRNGNLFAHEIAHQWFGDSVTESDWDHTWLSEGFATYLTHVYNEYTVGRDEMVRGLRRDRDTVIRYNVKNPSAAVVMPADAALDNILSTNSYQKGGWVLHMLRRLVGDEPFWKGLATYYARFRNANALTDDFRRVMEEVSGKPLEGFFRQWVYTPGQPLIQGSWSYANGVLTVRLEQAQADRIVFDTPLDIGIVTDRSAATRVETVPLGHRTETFTFQVDKEPLDVVLDPNTWLLAEFGRFERQ